MKEEFIINVMTLAVHESEFSFCCSNLGTKHTPQDCTHVHVYGTKGPPLAPAYLPKINMAKFSHLSSLVTREQLASDVCFCHRH